MVKHTQNICRQQPTNCLSVFDHFVGLALKGLKISLFSLIGSSHRRCSIKRAVLKFAIFTHGNTCVGVSETEACNFIKKRLQHRFFPVNITKFLRTPILKNMCERLLLFDASICLLNP